MDGLMKFHELASIDFQTSAVSLISSSFSWSAEVDLDQHSGQVQRMQPTTLYALRHLIIIFKLYKRRYPAAVAWQLQVAWHRTYEKKASGEHISACCAHIACHMQAGR